MRSMPAYSCAVEKRPSAGPNSVARPGRETAAERDLDRFGLNHGRWTAAKHGKVPKREIHGVSRSWCSPFDRLRPGQPNVLRLGVGIVRTLRRIAIHNSMDHVFIEPQRDVLCMQKKNDRLGMRKDYDFVLGSKRDGRRLFRIDVHSVVAILWLG